MPKPPRLCDAEYRNSQHTPSKPDEGAKCEGCSEPEQPAGLPRGLLTEPPIPNTGRTKLAIAILFSLGDGLIRCVVRSAIAPRVVARGARPLVTNLREPPSQSATLPMARLFASS